MSQYHVHRGFLVRNNYDYDTPPRRRALDARRRSRDEEDPDEEGALVIHNHIPLSGEPERYYDRARDDEENREEPEEGDVVARFPADKFHFATEGDEVVVYRGAGTPKHKTDIYDIGTRDSRSRPPRTLAELNRLHATHYGRKAAR